MPPFVLTCFTAGLIGAQPGLIAFFGNFSSQAEWAAHVDALGSATTCRYNSGTMLTALFSVLIGALQLGLHLLRVGLCALRNRPQATLI